MYYHLCTKYVSFSSLYIMLCNKIAFHLAILNFCDKIFVNFAHLLLVCQGL